MDVEVTVYNVVDRYGKEYTNDEEWYEYTAQLIDGERVVDEWDSLFETYNGVKGQRLTKEEAERAAEEIRNDGPEEWFSMGDLK